MTVSEPREREPAPSGRRWFRASLLVIGALSVAVAVTIILTDNYRWVYLYAALHVVPGLIGGLLVGSFVEAGTAGDPAADRSLLGNVLGASAVQVLIGALLTPLTAVGRYESLDWSWILVAVFVLGLASLTGMIAGWLAALLVIRPLHLVVTSAPRAWRGDREARAALALAMLLPTIVLWAVALRLGSGRGPRDGLVGTLRVFVGLDDGLRNGWMWAARTSTAALVALVAYLARRPGAIRRRFGGPDASGPP